MGATILLWKDLIKIQEIPGQYGYIWLECPPVHQNVVGFITGQGTYVSCEFNPLSGHIWEGTDGCFSLIFSLSPTSLSKIYKNISLG